jgi:hypothetical protein
LLNSSNHGTSELVRAVAKRALLKNPGGIELANSWLAFEQQQLAVCETNSDYLEALASLKRIEIRRREELRLKQAKEVIDAPRKRQKKPEQNFMEQDEANTQEAEESSAFLEIEQ